MGHGSSQCILSDLQTIIVSCAQYVTENTTPNSKHPTSGSLLDIVLCNDAFAICDVAVSELFRISDRYSVSFKLTFTNHNFIDGTFDFRHHNFDSVDWNVVNSHLVITLIGHIFLYLCQH